MTVVEDVVFTGRDRDAFLRHVRSSRDVVSKNDLIVALCRKKSVLDLGCIDHNLVKIADQGDQWLHHRIHSVASELVGLDTESEAAELLNQRGYRIVVGDAETFRLGGTFDVLVAGDLIEHLANMGLFLGSCRQHMHSESLLVITTPNPFCAERAVRAMLRNEVSANRQHVAWIDPSVMFELVTRYGFTIRGFQWIATRFTQEFTYGGPVAKVLNLAIAEVMKHRPVTRRDFAVVLSAC